MKQQILKLNSNYYPIAVTDWKTAMVDIVSGSAFPIDIMYELDSSGTVNKNKIEWMNVVKKFSEWAEMPIREFDDYVNSPNKSYRLPSIIICSNFDKIIFKKVMFPTKANIWKRDNYTCAYTGEKLTKDTLSVDHIIPCSRNGPNSWENLITASKKINTWKGDRTPKECGLKLRWKPTRPNNGLIFDFMRDEWHMFISGGKFE